MRVADVFRRDRMTFSFEFLPPKSETGWERLFERIREFEVLPPSFVSVTYGSGGTTRAHRHELVVRLKREAALDPAPHLACMGQGRVTVQSVLQRYANAGVSNIPAVRGIRCRSSGRRITGATSLRTRLIWCGSWGVQRDESASGSAWFRGYLRGFSKGSRGDAEPLGADGSSEGEGSGGHGLPDFADVF